MALSLSLINLPKLNTVLRQNIAPCFIQTRNTWGHVNVPLKTKHRPNKHKDPQWSKARAAKVLKIDLPDIEFERKLKSDKVTPEEIRARFKRQGVLPPKPYIEKPFFLASTSAIFDSFVPSERDGKASFLSKESALEQKELVKAKGKSLMATRRIRGYEGDGDFSASSFAEIAQDIYIKAHEAVMTRDEKEILKYATEFIVPMMMASTDKKTIDWKFIKSLEPPKVLQVRCVEVLSKKNHFAQVTVRFHTQQILAVYDRFGRLIHGNPVVAKDVLEYVVFEKYVASIYGEWRLHQKIIPDWLAKERPASLLTQVLPKFEDEPEQGVPASSEVQKVSNDEEVEEEGVLYDAKGRRINK